MRTLGFAFALVLLVLAGAVGLLASDVRSWQRTVDSDDALLAVSPANATWQPATRIPYSLAERALGLQDDIAARRAIALFRRTAGVEQQLNDAQRTSARGRAEAALAEIARDPNLARASQAETLLGILVFTDISGANPFETSVGPPPDQVEQSLANFQDAVRADPDNVTAKYNLELVIRTLAAQGIRVGSAQQSGAGATGKRGAGGGVPGQGY